MDIFLVVYPRYWDTVLEMSWPRFTYVVELNVDSVRNTDPQKLGVIDIRPHYVSTDSFLYSILMHLLLDKDACQTWFVFLKSIASIALRVVRIKF